MKKVILFLIIGITSLQLSYAQKIEDVGAGVIDFLLRNPKTANKLNSSESIALDIIGDLLKTKSERRHQIEYASASSNQITFNTNKESQAQIIKDEMGHIFLLNNGIIYPVSQELVHQAYSSNINSNKNNDYDDHILKDNFVSKTIDNYKINDIFFFKWYKDFNNDGKVASDEFNSIKSSFYDNENFKIAINAYVPSPDENYEILNLDLLNEYTGSIIKGFVKPLGKINTGQYIFHDFEISSGELPEGSYLIYATIKDNKSDKIYTYSKKRFEILLGNSKSKEINSLELKWKKMNNSSTPNGIFFYNKWIDSNKNNQYDYDEFLGLNKKSYNLNNEEV